MQNHKNCKTVNLHWQFLQFLHFYSFYTFTVLHFYSFTVFTLYSFTALLFFTLLQFLQLLHFLHFYSFYSFDSFDSFYGFYFFTVVTRLNNVATLPLRIFKISQNPLGGGGHPSHPCQRKLQGKWGLQPRFSSPELSPRNFEFELGGRR